MISAVEMGSDESFFSFSSDSLTVMGKMNLMIPSPKQTYESITVSVLYHRLMTIIISSHTKVPDRRMYETILKLKTKD